MMVANFNVVNSSDRLTQLFKTNSYRTYVLYVRSNSFAASFTLLYLQMLSALIMIF
jgi:hypothetical protein